MDDFFRKPFTLDRIARIFFVSALVVLGIYIIGGIRQVLIPFIIAWIAAVMIIPVVEFVQYKMRVKNRVISILIVLLLLVGVIIGVISLLIPSIVREGRKVWELILYYSSPELLLNIVPEEYRQDVVDALNLDYLFSQFDIQEILGYVQSFFERGLLILSGTISFLSGFAVVGIFLLFTFFILKDYEKLNQGIVRLFPDALKPFVLDLGVNINKYVTNYFRGQGLIAMTVGILLAIGFWLMGMPMGITCGLFIGFLNLVPYMQTLGIIPMTLLCMLQSASTGQNFWVLLMIALGILGLCQLIQDTFLTPTILGRKMGMLPAVLLLSLTVWGSLLGLVGLVFALPLTMILYTFYMKYVIGKPIEEDELLPRPTIAELRERFLMKRLRKRKNVQ